MSSLIVKYKWPEAARVKFEISPSTHTDANSASNNPLMRPVISETVKTLRSDFGVIRSVEQFCAQVKASCDLNTLPRERQNYFASCPPPSALDETHGFSDILIAAPREICDDQLVGAKVRRQSLQVSDSVG